MAEWDGENLPEYVENFIGHELRVGDYIVYATSSNSSAKLTFAKIVGFATHDANGQPYEHRSYNYDTCEYENAFLIRPVVQPINDNSWWGRTTSKESQLPRRVVLNSFANIVKVDHTFADIPEGV